ncbi:MAG: hypothetical protein Homavirus12_2 [Homavirus sp.]|uniref:Uncharacterized protein n=1 Tax=Homavirus sp. TaxID=2487769 RepID=A0A3G5A4L8_9VIRU|nr:MAG: hypothetical protein Homavirus12_2 [Homavirus sp.]
MINKIQNPTKKMKKIAKKVAKQVAKQMGVNLIKCD